MTLEPLSMIDECDFCGYIYNPVDGDPDNGISPGTSFADIPIDDWYCPVCGASKAFFSSASLPTLDHGPATG